MHPGMICQVCPNPPELSTVGRGPKGVPMGGTYIIYLLMVWPAEESGCYEILKTNC